jgi:multidrug resistance efflux pump
MRGSTPGTRFSPAAGPECSFLRPDNATGSFTKVARRILVRIEIDPEQPQTRRISPGMSVVVSVDMRQEAVRRTDGANAHL